tara:strand:+ start:145 stop:459 length:315 start_codon:yes stop_codon:yes gene_type:complete
MKVAKTRIIKKTIVILTTEGWLMTTKQFEKERGPVEWRLFIEKSCGGKFKRAFKYNFPDIDLNNEIDRKLVRQHAWKKEIAIGKKSIKVLFEYLNEHWPWDKHD